MKRVGICTLYYNNVNYGGNLQAYALQKTVSSFGYNTEVISYYNNSRSHLFLSKLKRFIKQDYRISKGCKIRCSAIKKYNTRIPHSKLYFYNTIEESNYTYDIIITGSDQVWNPNWINKYMSLDFVNKDKLTISYAASTGRIRLSHDEECKLKRALDNTKFISIREKESIPALCKLTSKNIEYVLDPTMLINREDWNEHCSKRIIQENYIFAYYLGDNEYIRKVAKEYANRRGLKLVTLPYLNGSYRNVDDGFGDCQLFDISPNDFISLIKYASFVLTDSFHATVFSHIFEREFLVSAKRGSEMGCRMKSLTELFGTEGRFIVEHELVTIDTLLALEKSTFDINWDHFEVMRQKSLLFLMEALDDD
ncbi:Polysaccharide pyruvyl transferase [Ruminococcus sp. YE71]|uniref:polysaccharide pyruvyl transferase family protein n=1 Tax=unclassified Ruminococcus TaxID=2608920 RepID=UPI00088E3E36|nr:MULTISPECIES: polysaccharide pyruvyl transferase family protein [unclassified Ruminococcus]SDA11333.1 Polysaccharide pyruvyl transferase [Ruminococcus sp. YE78]SFW15086.1 Polysaccharide pyruvyl transferase [Ruminococcus sp. YE71]